MRRSHSWCCNFEQELLAWLASRLGEYADRIADGGGAPWGYPNPEEAEGGPNGVTDFDAWVRDVTDVAKTLRYAAEHYGELSESNQLIAEVDAALAWVARWRRAVWI